MDPRRREEPTPRRLSVAAALVLTAAVLAAPAAPAVDPEAAGTGEWRYVWLDADGRPLPFQSDAEIESFLRTARVVETTRLKVGVTEPLKLLLEQDGVRAHAVFKDIDDSKRSRMSTVAGERRLVRHWRDHHAFDCASYRLDRLLGLGRVPPSVRRQRGSTPGTVTLWLEGTLPESRRRELGIEPPDAHRWNAQRTVRAVWDSLVYDLDSNLGNTLIDRGWNQWFIDCSRCFNRSPEPLWLERVDHCERRLWEALRSVDDDAIRTAMDPWLTAAEIGGLLARRARLVEHLQGLIASRGEEAVLFELEPHRGQPASWPR